MSSSFTGEKSRRFSVESDIVSHRPLRIDANQAYGKRRRWKAGKSEGRSWDIQTDNEGEREREREGWRENGVYFRRYRGGRRVPQANAPP